MSAGGGLRKRRTFFVQVPREAIRSSTLSFKAKGILGYLLDLPDGWVVRSDALARVGPDGKEGTQSGLRELRAEGNYRVEQRRLLGGTFTMGTAVSETAVPSWAAEHKEFGGKAVPVVQQCDGSFRVQHKDGTLTDDGFGEEHVDEPPVEDTTTGDGKPVPGETPSTGDGKTGTGLTDTGSPVPLREKEEGRKTKEQTRVVFDPKDRLVSDARAIATGEQSSKPEPPSNPRRRKRPVRKPLPPDVRAVFDVLGPEWTTWGAARWRNGIVARIKASLDEGLPVLAAQRAMADFANLELAGGKHVPAIEASLKAVALDIDRDYACRDCGSPEGGGGRLCPSCADDPAAVLCPDEQAAAWASFRQALNAGSTQRTLTTEGAS